MWKWMAIPPQWVKEGVGVTVEVRVVHVPIPEPTTFLLPARRRLLCVCRQILHPKHLHYVLLQGYVTLSLAALSP